MTGERAPMLELQRITHRFGNTLALDDAGIAVHAGTVHALLGENGAGKTTLMRVAFGLVHADTGSVRIAGTAVYMHSPADAIAHGIGMVHQHFTLIPAMTVAENVALGGHGLFDPDAVARSLHALGAESGIAMDPGARADALTVAQQQRLEIVKALHRNARILILDEPTAVLAPGESNELLRWLRGFVARGNAAVLITHKLGEALAVADAITVLRRGRLVAQLDARAATRDTLTTAMLGDAAAPPEYAARLARTATSAPPAASTAPGASVARTEPSVVVGSHHVSASRGREQLHDVTLELRGGEIVGVAGVEGAGHHLLTRLLARRAPARAGVLTLPDEIGFIPEDRHRDALIAEQSLAENVALKGAGQRRGRMKWGAWRERVATLVAMHDVRGVAADSSAGDVVAATLSGGNQQKLVVARELAGEPQLVVAENPTRGLDVRAAAAVRTELRAAAVRGAAVLVYSADIDEVLALADRVLVVHAGRVRECAVDRDAVGRAMLGVA